MTTATVISICISAFSLLLGGGVVFKLIDLGRFTGRMEQRLDHLTQRAAEDRKKDAEKFDTLYNNRNEQDRRLVKLETQLESIVSELEQIRIVVDGINGKVDGLVMAARP